MKKEKRSLQAVEMKVATFSDERLCKAQLTFKEARTSSNFNNMSSESQLDSVKERQSMKSLLRARQRKLCERSRKPYETFFNRDVEVQDLDQLN